jgi:DNA-binding winged helix-turn-helix (wHTH) protein
MTHLPFLTMKQRLYTRARLGPFAVDVRTGELNGDGAPSLLPQQVLQVLVILMERDRDLVTREELKKML